MRHRGRGFDRWVADRVCKIGKRGVARSGDLPQRPKEDRAGEGGATGPFQETDVVLGGGLGYKDVFSVSCESSIYKDNDLAIEGAVGIPQFVPCVSPGASLAGGVNFQGSGRKLVAVPSLISSKYPVKDRLAQERFREIYNAGYRFLKQLDGSPFFTPGTDSIKMLMYHKGYSAQFIEYPFEEWEDGMPWWQQPQYSQ